MKSLAALMIAITTAITGAGTKNAVPQQPKPVVSYTDDYTITVNKATNCVTVYQKDLSGNLTPVKAMICSVGKNKEDTPAGSFKTQAKYTWRPLFGNVYGQYATRINGHILFHSVYYKTTDPSTLKTEEYNNLGTAASAGCVRLTAGDAKWIYDNCKIGTRVNIIENGTDPLPRPDAIKLGKNASYPNWDPTDPHPDNPWKNENVKIKLSLPPRIVRASDAVPQTYISKILGEGVTAYDSANNIIKYDVSCNVSTVTPGIYPVKYSARDCLGNHAEVYSTLTVTNE